MEHVQIGSETRASGGRSVNLQQEIADQRAGDDADGEAGHADARSQQHAAENDHDVVDDGSERGHDEASLGILNGAENAAFVKAELRGKHQTREENDARFFLRRKARRDQARELRRKNFAGHHEGGKQQAHEGHDRGEDVPAFLFAAFGGVFGEDGNERDAQ